jgi:ribosomal protein S18 acetylase RimI-like enzyme
VASVGDAPEIRPASSISPDRLVRAFNDGYTGYHVPVHVDRLELDHHIQQNDIDLDQSRVAIQHEQVIGIGLLGLRGERGWIGGLGVHPAHRRAGIGRTLMQALIEAGRANHLTAIQLEVIAENEAAHRLYQSLGFTDTRRLLVLSHPPEKSDREGSQLGESASLADMLPLYKQFHADPTPWQRGYPSLMRLDSSTRIWLAPDRARPSAYAIGFATASLIHLLDLACAPGCEALLTNLVRHIQNIYPEAAGRIVNVAEDEVAWPVLSELGWQIMLTQWEMHLPL